MRRQTLSLLGITTTAMLLCGCSQSMSNVYSPSNQATPHYLTPGVKRDGTGYFNADPQPVNMAPVFNPPRFYRTSLRGMPSAFSAKPHTYRQ